MPKTATNGEATLKEQQERKIKTLVTSRTQAQKSRIKQGNRLVANFRQKLGIESDEEAEEKQQSILKQLEKDYKRLTDGIAKITAARSYPFSGIIDEYYELRLVDVYMTWKREEERITQDIRRNLRGIPIWDEYLSDVTGVGPATAGAIISELDPYEAPYPSSFWSYCGLDVVTVWKLDDFDWEKSITGQQPPNYEVEKERKHLYREGADDNEFDEVSYEPSDDSEQVAHVWKVFETDEGTWRLRLTYRQVSQGGRSRKREHLKTVEYVNSDGEVDTKKSLGYNPWIKTKLMGVLSKSFLRNASDMRDHYDDYRHRIENMPAHEDKTDGHIHQMALRKMMKEFLKRLWAMWRYLEEQPIPLPYHVEKLGMDGHGICEELGIEDPIRPGDGYPHR